MIGKLKGVIDSYGEDFIVLDVHGVGYLVSCSARTLQSLPATGEAATLSIETHVREGLWAPPPEMVSTLSAPGVASRAFS